MNAVTEHNKPTRLDEYRVQVLPPERAQELWRSLPSHIRPAVYERNLMNALMANPALMDFDPRLIFREVAKAAALGLLLDPILGEGYIVTAYNYKTRRTEPQLRVGYKGMCKLARQSGNVATIYVHEVCALDHVECDLGFPKILKIKPKLFGERGDIVGYVAVITFKDGTFDFEPMSVEECQSIRDRSDAWKAFAEGKIKSTPWSTDEVEMSKKTTLRRLMKRQEQSPEMAQAIRIEDEAEQVLDAPISPPRPPRVPGPNEMEELPATRTEASPLDDHGTDKYRPGDVVDIGTGAAMTINVAEPATTSSGDTVTTGPQGKQWLMPNIATDYDGWVTSALDKIAHMEDGGELETFWNQIVEPKATSKDLLPSDYEDLIDACSQQQKKLGSEE